MDTIKKSGENAGTPETLDTQRQKLTSEIKNLSKEDTTFSPEDKAFLSDPESKSIPGLENVDTLPSEAQNGKNQLAFLEELANVGGENMQEDFDKKGELQILEALFNELQDYVTKTGGLGKNHLKDLKNFPLEDIKVLAERYNDNEKLDLVNQIKNKIIELEAGENHDKDGIDKFTNTDINNDIHYNDDFDIDSLEATADTMLSNTISLKLEKIVNENGSKDDFFNAFGSYTLNELKDIALKNKDKETLKILEKIENSDYYKNLGEDIEYFFSIQEIEKELMNLSATTFGTDEYNKISKKIIEKTTASPIFKENENMLRLIALMAGDFLGEKSEIDLGDASTSKENNELIKNLSNILSGTSTGHEDEGEKFINNKKDIYLAQILIRLITSPEKYKEVFKEINQKNTEIENYYNSLPDGKGFEVIGKHSQIMKQNEEIKKGYNILKNQLKQEEVNKQGIENYKQNLEGALNKNLHGILEKNEIKILTENIFTENKIDLEKATLFIFNNHETKFVQIFDKIKDLEITENIKNLGEKIHQLATNNPNIKESLKKYHVNDTLDIQKFWSDFDGYRGTYELENQKVNLSGLDDGTMLGVDVSAENFLKSLGITEKNEAYKDILEILYEHQNSTPVTSNIDGKELYEHLKSGGTYDSYIQKIKTEIEQEKNITEKEKQKDTENTFSPIDEISKNLDFSYISENGQQKEIPITAEEIQKLKTPEAQKNYIDFYKETEKLGLTSLWTYRKEIMIAMGDTFVNAFDQKGLEQEELHKFKKFVLEIATEKKYEENISYENIDNKLADWSAGGDRGMAIDTKNTLGEDLFLQKLKKYDIIKESGSMDIHALQKMHEGLQ